MVKKFSYRAGALVFTALVIIVLYSFKTQPVYTENGVVAQYTFELNQNIIALDKTAEAYKQGVASVDSLQHILTKTRLSYKKAEFYLAFHYPEFVKENINGAPLLHIEKEGTMPKVLQPVGLQVLDEMIFSEDPASQKNEIEALAKTLKNSYSNLYKSLEKNGLRNRLGVTAMRVQLVRMVSLGITGFDTPGSLNALNEAKASLTGIKEFYKQEYAASANFATNVSLLDSGISQLSTQNSFNDFDRLAFIKNVIDPLYKNLGLLENSYDENLVQTSSWNPKSQSIFGTDFLNPYFFSQLKPDEDSAGLRALGKALFYDNLLSADNTMNCASCHAPDKAFTDGIPKSLSNVQGKTVLRNAPTLLNAVYADRYFYDLRAFTLEQQAEHVIFNPNEFNTAYSAILKKLEANKGYQQQFKKLFGKKGVTRENFSKALASYVLSLQSFNSDFDKYIRGENNTLNQDARQGFNLFMGKAACATCHFVPTFAGLVPPLYNENESEILGVLANPLASAPKLDEDKGRLDNQIYNEYAWIYERSVKTTTVRNAALTAPYFHNGAYATLDQVIDFYNKGGGGGLGLNVTNQTLPPDPLNLTDSEVKALVAFITSLNDVSAAHL
ncbi:cytochrome-c peroxidase [Flavobacterium sp. RHBU_24]|uniref:cytochrome-c peroxidase n=1 Tax=Flavobacterium sp. RHBU_24 TaxID=3391185 RepID=UPI003984D653